VQLRLPSLSCLFPQKAEAAEISKHSTLHPSLQAVFKYLSFETSYLLGNLVMELQIRG
jgi:hypothetical protein